MSQDDTMFEAPLPRKQQQLEIIADNFCRLIGVDAQEAREKGWVDVITPEKRRENPYWSDPDKYYEGNKEYISLPVPAHAEGGREASMLFSQETQESQLQGWNNEKRDLGISPEVAARLFNILLPRPSMSDRMKKHADDGSRLVWIYANQLDEAVKTIGGIEAQQQSLGYPLRGAMAFGSALQRIISGRKDTRGIKVKVEDALELKNGQHQLYLYEAPTHEKNQALLRLLKEAKVDIDSAGYNITINVPPPECRAEMLKKLETLPEQGLVRVNRLPDIPDIKEAHPHRHHTRRGSRETGGVYRPPLPDLIDEAPKPPEKPDARTEIESLQDSLNHALKFLPPGY